jgi:hypothetical protein
MNVKRLLVDALTVFSVTLVVCIIVTVLGNLIVHKAGTIDWETSFRFAIVLGIMLPWLGTRRNKEK